MDARRRTEGETVEQMFQAVNSAPAEWHVGDAVHVVKGTNSNDSVREGVPAEILRCVGPIVVVARTDPGRFLGEGLWCWVSDVREPG